jgi:hypothetical protein
MLQLTLVRPISVTASSKNSALKLRCSLRYHFHCFVSYAASSLLCYTLTAIAKAILLFGALSQVTSLRVVVSNCLVDGDDARAEKVVNMDDFMYQMRLDILVSGKYSTHTPTMNANDLTPVIGLLSRRAQSTCCFSCLASFVYSLAVFINPSTLHKVFAYKDTEECSTVCDNFERNVDAQFHTNVCSRFLWPKLDVACF